MNKFTPCLLFLSALLAASPFPASARSKSITIVSTADVYGRWLDSTFVKPQTRPSLLGVEKVINGLEEEGKSVLLLDAGHFAGKGNISFYDSHEGKGHLEKSFKKYLGYSAMLPAEDEGDAGCVLLKKKGLRVAFGPLSSVADFASRKKASVVVATYPGKAFRKSEPSLQGVDVLLLYGDNRALVQNRDSVVILDPAFSCKNVSIAEISVDSGVKTLSGRNVSIGAGDIDPLMRAHFGYAYKAVGEFSRKPIGILENSLPVLPGYIGQSDYISFYHSLALGYPGVDVSFSAFLALDGSLPAGNISWNSIASLYPFDNRLEVLRMTGGQIKAFLEASYDSWIQTWDGEHLLRLKDKKDVKTGEVEPFFACSPANFETAGGLVYTVDITKTAGERVVVEAFADGSPFYADSSYNVSMTSYRLSGAGGLLQAAGFPDAASVSARLVEDGPEFRELLYDYVLSDPVVSVERISDPSVVGSWSFVPAALARSAGENDLREIYAGKAFPYTGYEGEYRAYDLTASDRAARLLSTDVPQGYTPVYVSYFGRHGSRYALRGVYDKVYKVLSQADSASNLTSDGKVLWEDYRKYYASVRPHAGELNALGRAQVRRIAEDFYRSYPSAFEGDTRAVAISTGVGRVIETMDIFTDELSSLDSAFSCSRSSGERYMRVLDPSDPDGPYSVGVPIPADAGEKAGAFYAETVDACAWAARVLKDPSLAGEKACLSLMKNLRGVSINSGLFTEYFGREDYRRLFEAWNYSGYLVFGPNSFGLACGERIFDYIASSAASDLTDGVNMRLSFSHDTALMPLLSYLGVMGFGFVTADPALVSSHWSCNNVPMGANVQFVVYRKAACPACSADSTSGGSCCASTKPASTEASVGKSGCEPISQGSASEYLLRVFVNGQEVSLSEGLASKFTHSLPR